jgi:hypothetical protein
LIVCRRALGLIRGDVSLRSRYAKKLGLKDKVCRVSELVLGRYLALFELAVVHNAITNEMFPLRVDPEVGRTGSERLVAALIVMLWGPGPRLNTPWLMVESARQGTGSLPQLVGLVGTADVLPIGTPISSTSKLSPFRNASVTVSVSPSLGATKFQGGAPTK